MSEGFGLLCPPFVKLGKPGTPQAGEIHFLSHEPQQELCERKTPPGP